MIYDRLWESGRLAKCSRDAALAYPWIFLIADDWGRFEFNPRRIWTKVFGGREDISLGDVQGWLTEYEKVELLLRYHIDGDLAVWYRFRGRKPSERRPSELPDPSDFVDIKRLGTTGGDDGAETGRKRRDKSPPDIEQIGSRADQELEQRARAAIDAYNAAFGTKIGPTPGNVRAAVRALEAGYSQEQIVTTFEAVRARKTPTAQWCADNNREFEYLIRPPYKHNRTHEVTNGPIEKILNELATGRKSG